MKIANGSFTSIAYVMRLDSGEEIDSTTADKPLGFVVGANQMMPGLENRVIGMQAGEKGSFVIEADEAYGPVRPELKEFLERSRFPADVELEPGKVFQAPTPQGILRFAIIGVEDDKVAVDFNHPLAGQRLHFDVEVVEVREARPEDLAPAGSRGCAHCGGHDHEQGHGDDGDGESCC